MIIEYFEKIYAMGKLIDETFTTKSDIDTIYGGIEEYTLLLYTLAFASGAMVGMIVAIAMVAFL